MPDDTGQYQNDISGLPKLTSYDMESIFQVYTDADSGSYYYNLCNSIFFPENLDQSTYTLYQIPNSQMSWTNLSYIHYGTIDLWWLLCCLNNVDNPLTFPTAGSYVKILNTNTLRSVLAQIQQGAS